MIMTEWGGRVDCSLLDLDIRIPLRRTFTVISYVQSRKEGVEWESGKKRTICFNIYQNKHKGPLCRPVVTQLHPSVIHAIHQTQAPLSNYTMLLMSDAIYIVWVTSHSVRHACKDEKRADLCVSRNSLHNTHSLIRMRFVWIVVLFFLSSLFVSIRYSEDKEVENRNSTSIPTLQFRRVVHSTPLYYPWDDGFGMLCVGDSHS